MPDQGNGTERAIRAGQCLSYAYGGFLGSGNPLPYSPGAYTSRFNNLAPVFQTDSSNLRPSPTVNVTDKRESEAGKLVDTAAALTLLAYPLDLYSAIYGETFFGREQLGTWERLLVAIHFASSIRRVGGAALDVGKNVVKKAEKLTAQQQKSIESYKKLILEHEKKLEAFKSNPTARPGMENLSKELIEKQWNSRINHLETEINTFKDNIEKIKRGELGS